MFIADWKATEIPLFGGYGTVGMGLLLTGWILRKWQARRPRVTAETLRRTLGEPVTSGRPAGKWRIAGVLLAALLAGRTAQAAMISNGTPAVLGGGLVLDTFVSAESFTLTSAMTIRGIEFADTEYTPTFTGTLNYFIYSNGNPYPDAILAQGSDPVLSKSFISDGGTLSISTVRYDFNLNTPVDLGPGTYWVALNFSGGGFEVWDSTTTPNAQLSAGRPVGTNNWNLDAVQLYLGISDTPLAATAAPEPGSILFAGMGMAWAAGRRCRTRTKPGVPKTEGGESPR